MLICRAGRQQQRLQLRMDPPVDEAIWYSTSKSVVLRTPRTMAEAMVPHREIRQQARPQLRLHIGQVRHRRPHQLELLLRCEHLVSLFQRWG